MKLLLVFDGIDESEMHLALRLHQRPDIDLQVFCSMRCRRFPQLQAAGVSVSQFRTRAKLDFNAILRLRRRLSEGRFDVVHAFTSKTLANVLLATTGFSSKPSVVGFRGVIDRIHRWDPASWLTYLHPRLSGLACISNCTFEAMKASGVAPEKLKTIYLASAENGALASRQVVRRELEIADDAFVVGFVGNIRPVKGVDVLLRAALELAHCNDIRWVLVGAVRDKNIVKLAQDPRLAGRVQLLGFRSDAVRLQAAFDICVLPSRKEGFGKAIMEAMRGGVCPVVSDVGGLPELVRHQRDGLVVPPDDPPALAAAIRKLQQQPELRRTYADSAARRIAEHFNIDGFTHDTLQLYQQARRAA